MYARQTHLLWPTAALLLGGCLIENTSEPVDPPPPPPLVTELDLKGLLLDESGAPARFLPVRLGLDGGPIVATDEAGEFVFPDVPVGEHTVYAYDELGFRAGSATVQVSASSADEVATIDLRSCNDVFSDDIIDNELLAICITTSIIDLPPFETDVTLAAVELSGGAGYTNRSNSSAYAEGGDVRQVVFAIHDGIALGGVREFEVADHGLVGAEPNPDEPLTPVFSISLQDRNGPQIYTVREGSFRFEIAEGLEATRGYVLTASNLVLDYRKSFEEFDPAYTLTVPSLRLEGTLDVELPPTAPEGNLTRELTDGFVSGDLDPEAGRVNLTLLGAEDILSVSLELAQLAFPGSVDIELPPGDEPDLSAGSLTVLLGDGSDWNFQLVSYTVTSEQTAAPACGERLSLTLENLVFRYVGWDYDENSNEVKRFGTQTLTIAKVVVDTQLFDPANPTCE